jgi:anti-sigma-K factor RskA
MERLIDGEGPRSMGHDEVQELLGVYAIHAVDDAEAVAINAHVQSCALCAIELERLFDSSAAFGMTELEEPSGEIWGRIQSEIRGPSETFAPLVPVASVPTASPVAEPMSNVIPLDAQRAARRSRFRVAAASAAAAVALAVPITMSLGGGPAPSLAALAKSAASQSGSRTVPLIDASGKTLAEAIISSTGQGFISAKALSALPDDKTYQLWLIGGVAPVSSGLLGSNPGVSTFTIRPDVAAIAISVEPAAGSTEPTTTPIALAQLA